MPEPTVTPLMLAKARTFANVVLARFNSGEGSINQIIEYYNQTTAQNDLIRAEILKRNPNLDLDSE